MLIKRLLYFGYYIKDLDRPLFINFINYTANKTGRNKLSIIIDIIYSVFRFNISILEYFNFRFFDKNTTERDKWAGTGYMYEYQLKMNPTSERAILNDKTKFYKRYNEYFIHTVADIADLESDPQTAIRLLNSSSKKLVFKTAEGKCGRKIEIKKTLSFDPHSLIRFMKDGGYDLVEEFIVQHPKLNELSPAAVNTVRIITQLDNKGEVHLLGCRLRISINGSVDNMAAGNIAAPVDEKTGIVIGPGVYSNITKPDEYTHPVTGIQISGFQIPFWEEIIVLCKNAALLYPQNRSIGWDVVVTEKGPGFIEGNHDWCKLLWQLPVKKGLKNMIIPFIN